MILSGLRPLTGTYRLQLRNGMDFSAACQQLDYIAGLGVSHLYLSPIFTAQTGSTHGYDVTDPAQIDPSLGGRAGFTQLSQHAQRLGLSVIIDIVPNHMAFGLQTPWLHDVLRNGAASRYYRHFDIDWSRKLVLPFLPMPFEDMLHGGNFSVTMAPDHHPVLRVVWDGGGFDVPLCEAPQLATSPVTDPSQILAVLQRQIWQLSYWEQERDAISHRRFFNITGLIGLRVEDDQVFADAHALTFDLIDAGLVHGLRVDHIDGLADPTAYCVKLRERVGEHVPIWVEKILTDDEPLPQEWPVDGTTGYEAGRQIARILTPVAGLQRLDLAWRAATGETGDFHTAVMQAKSEIIVQELAAELHQLIALGHQALAAQWGDQVGPEAMREAILALLQHFPRYRLYIGSKYPEIAGDHDLMQHVTQQAAAAVRSDRVVRALGAILTAPNDDPGRAFVLRFEQVTGALIAKSQEDTAFFRYNLFLAANEVGAEPDAATLDVPQFNNWLQSRQAQWPRALTLTSSHDTKRAEDARMRILAIAHCPAEFAQLFDAEFVQMPGVQANIGWYVVQSALGLFDPRRDDMADRLAAHMEKALREGKQISNWMHPDLTAETAVFDGARALIARWQKQVPTQVQKITDLAQSLGLLQVALKHLMPGVPDLYQGCELGAYQLTDPDNRETIDFARLRQGAALSGYDGAKAALTAHLLQLRADRAAFFDMANVSITVDQDAPDHMVLTRQRGADDHVIKLRFSPNLASAPQPISGTSLLPAGHHYPFDLVEAPMTKDLSAATKPQLIFPVSG
ncbi:malto-oligosyltrehalose synthase [Thioclava sp. SK-1]|uniref:malto-oligosyltrehalose synthase n=1 Tax=Thioclava sp. SK-1 TaxID=1889770 RepID=UPI000825117A|nr:malto-oligosyltrehalose synthase [Thioclava sp. SK-1]OCX63155.1 malto-oligosyltrehalose synthase [Thioclava sp. SK-1]